MPSTDKVKPIPECEFCCVPPERRKADFNERHPRCAACGILMGRGHVERVNEYCSSCRA